MCTVKVATRSDKPTEIYQISLFWFYGPRFYSFCFILTALTASVPAAASSCFQGKALKSMIHQPNNKVSSKLVNTKEHFSLDMCHLETGRNYWCYSYCKWSVNIELMDRNTWPYGNTGITWILILLCVCCICKRSQLKIGFFISKMQISCSEAQIHSTFHIVIC